jgi:hypothetical protein
MLSLAIFGGNRVDGGMIDPGERVVGVALFGAIDFDFASIPPPPATEVTIVAVFGGAGFKVRAQQALRLSGFSIFGGRNIEAVPQLSAPPQPTDAVDETALPLEISAYAVFGGINIKRVGPTMSTDAGGKR